MNHDKIVYDLSQEFRRGTLILVTLSQLKISTYGYDLVKKLSSSQIKIEANTLYPLLRRLEAQGILESRWDTEEGKPRKYYKLSNDGEIVQEKLKAEWLKYSQNVNELMGVLGENIEKGENL